MVCTGSEMSIIIAGRYQNFTIAIALHGGDEPAFFHLFKKTGRPVVSNAQMALDKRDGCAPVFQDNGYSLIVKRVCLAICRMFPTDTGRHRLLPYRLPVFLRYSWLLRAPSGMTRHDGLRRPKQMHRERGSGNLCPAADTTCRPARVTSPAPIWSRMVRESILLLT